VICRRLYEHVIAGLSLQQSQMLSLSLVWPSSWQNQVVIYHL